jgi:hypothetical protein
MERDRVRLKQILASYGADRSRWPEADRQLAMEMGDAEEEAGIDTLLDQASAPHIPASAADRLIARAAGLAPPSNVRILPPGRNPQVWYSIVALAASLALGVFIGVQEDVEDVLPLGLATSVDDATALTGLGEVEDVLNGELS